MQRFAFCDVPMRYVGTGNYKRLLLLLLWLDSYQSIFD